MVTREKKHLKRIENIDSYFTAQAAPKVYGSSPDNILIRQRKQFEAVCTALKAQGIDDPKNLTTFEFYSTVEYFETLKKPKHPK